MKGILEEGDIEEALNAANAIGDDRLQMEARGYVVPESFTHGTSEQRKFWFKKGFDSGNLSDGDTFGSEL
jgi:predicted metalloprotease